MADSIINEYNGKDISLTKHNPFSIQIHPPRQNEKSSVGVGNSTLATFYTAHDPIVHTLSHMWYQHICNGFLRSKPHTYFTHDSSVMRPRAPYVNSANIWTYNHTLVTGLGNIIVIIKTRGLETIVGIVQCIASHLALHHKLFVPIFVS